MNDLLEKIHLERTRLAQENQAVFSNELNALNDVLYQMELKHPFQYSDKLFQKLKKASVDFETGASSTALKLKIEEPCLYRYTTFRSLIKNKNLRWQNKAVDRNTAFEVLQDRINTTNQNEFNLSEFMMGSYKNSRGFSWWTKQSITCEEDVFGLGIPSDWIAERSVIMKIKDPDIIKNQLKTPSVIDAFDSPIFYPTKYDQKENTVGITLNLNNRSTFNDGYEEYVTGNINADKIYITPFTFDVGKKEIFIESILQDLLNFYNTK